MIRHVGTFMIFWSAVVGVASVFVHALTPWRRTAMGRHLMAYMTAFAVVLVLSCIRIAFGDSEWFQLIRLVVFVSIPIVMTWRLYLQISVHPYMQKRRQKQTVNQPR